MFKIYKNKGFQMTFENGYTISVMFGVGNYCEHYSNKDLYDSNNIEHASRNAEIAIFWHAGMEDALWATRAWRPELCDDVVGSLNADEVAEAIAWTQSQPATAPTIKPFM